MLTIEVVEDFGNGYSSESRVLNCWVVIKVCNSVGNILPPNSTCVMMTMVGSRISAMEKDLAIMMHYRKLAG